MSRPSTKDRFACDRMAGMANLMVWHSSGEDANESVASAYECNTCKEWKKEETL